MDATHNVVPDSSRGWIIVAAVALINMTNQSLLSVFGLLFGGQLKSMQQETFTAALITNLNSLALNFSGLFIGPAIKSFQPRNVATTGCIMVSFGMFLCAFATQGWHFIIGYSFFVGLGLGLISPSTFMAINSHFNAKRGRAVGVSLAGAGLGQVFMPHLVRLLLDYYNFRIAVLSMSLVSLLGLIGTLLLKPLQTTQTHNNQQHINPLLQTDQNMPKTQLKIQVVPQAVLPNTTTTTQRKMLQRFVQAMDLELLKDVIFLNIIIGMALVYTSTISFTMLYPNFLRYTVGLSSANTATCMSAVAGADIMCRLLLPVVTDKLKIPYRLVFLLGTVGLLIARAALAESADITTIIVMSVFTGMTKSATVLNNNLTISGYCRPEKLAGGLGLNMMSKGVLVITVGQLLGWIRDYTNSYVLCMHAQNFLLFFVIVVWAPEICYRYCQQQKREKNVNTKNPASPEELIKVNAC